MKSRNSIVMIMVVLLVVLLAGTGITLYLASLSKPSNETAEKTGMGKYSEYDLFLDVPVMAREDIVYTEAQDVGGGDYMITAGNTALSDYKDYLSVLEEEGFEKVVDNGENGIEGFVYTAHYKKKDLLVVVSHIVNLEKTTITANENALLSEHLFYDEAYVQENQPNAKTSFHLLEMEEVGNSFLLQLKNGHFILYDGGKPSELPYLLEYMEALVPAGQKPVIEVWFISHAHSDHMGILKAFADDKSYAERVYIESVYYDEPSTEMVEIAGIFDTVNKELIYCKTAEQYLKSSDGSHPEVYHPRLGERYYFNDFTVDIIYTLELLPAEDWDTWNSTSTVMMFTIEGQKMMLTGDSDWCTQVVYTDMYDKEYFDLDVYQVPHHGINVYKQLTNRLGTIRTAIYPTRALGTVSGEGSVIGRKTQNEHLISVALEALSWADGTKILTFPYEIGSAQTLPQKFVTEE